jgi:methyl-accepting chemotaxis protein
MHANDLIQKDEFRHLMEEIGDLGLGVLCKVLKQHSEGVSSLASRITQLGAENKLLKKQAEEVEKNLSRQASDTDSMMSKIDNIDQCKHCPSPVCDKH